jgi:hypothetical protein
MADFLRLLGQILRSGATPELGLIKRFALPLIGLVTVPPLLHDLYDHLTPRTPEEQRDLDRERERLSYRLRHIILGWRVCAAPTAEADATAAAARAFIGAFAGELQRYQRAAKAGVAGGVGQGGPPDAGVPHGALGRTKAKHAEEVLAGLGRIIALC